MGAWQFRNLVNDIALCLAFYTRLPVPSALLGGGDFARAGWAAPIIGALVGAAGAAAYWIASTLGLSPLVAATLTLAATLLLTGCLHEDGLADVADGFGGGRTRERKLEIMRDSRIGTYGVAALAVSLLLRVGLIASLGDPALVAAALVGAHAAARAPMAPMMRLMPPARMDGLSAGAGRPPLSSASIAVVIGVLALALGLGLAKGATALALLIVAGLLMARLAMRQIGGQTGDVLGATEQVCEAAVLIVAAASI